jgi:hypothetical protein
MKRTEPPPLSTTQFENKLVSEVEVQAPRPKWVDGALNGSLVLIGISFFLYMWL